MSATTSIDWTDATWPVVAGCKDTVSGCGIDRVLEEFLSRAVEPVKILEEEDGRLPGARGARKLGAWGARPNAGAEAGSKRSS